MVVQAILSVVFAVTIVPSYEPPISVVEVFREFEYRYSGGRYDEHLFRYRLLVPERIDQSKQYPLILWLHGEGEHGDDNRAQLRWFDLVLSELNAKRTQCFILAVQYPLDVHGWYASYATGGSSGAADDMLTVAMTILDQTIADWPVEPDRIYLSGVSSGGTGCWELAMRYPDRFAAVAPIASSGGDLSRLERIRDVPIWAFHNKKDTAPRPEVVQRTVDALDALGGNVHLTLVDNLNHDAMDALNRHDCWTGAIRHFDVLKWLFKQRRGAWFAAAPEQNRWEWLNYMGVPLAFVGICVAAWIAEKRRRLTDKKRLQEPCPSPAD